MNVNFIYTIASIAIILTILFLTLHNKNQKIKDRVLLVITIFTIALYFIYKHNLSNDATFLESENIPAFSWWNELPLNICNVCLLFFPFVIWKKSQALASYSVYLSLPAALGAIASPTAGFVGESILLPRYIGYFGTHGLIIVISICLLCFGYCKPSLREVYRVPAFLLLHIGLVHLLNMFLRQGLCPHANYMFTFSPEPAALKPMWELVPIPFFYFLPLLPLLILWCLLLTILHSKISKKRQKQN